MSTQRQDRTEADRRTILKLAGIGIGVASLPAAAEAQSAPDEAAHGAMPGMTPAPAPAPAAGDAPLPDGYVFLNLDEAPFVEAFVDTLIPEDEFGPAGTALGVATFVDRQLNSGFGRGDRMYLQGPFHEGTPEQGYQMPLTPNELVRAGIADVNAYVARLHDGYTFDGLEPADRVKIVTGLERGQIALPTVPTAIFFGTLYQLVMDGFFADPIYGGNKGKASWKMLGYPGIGEMYADKIESWRNKPYRADPLSIQDLS
ncbi:MAG TPA: gluconate 2-dehydrogenase subunit 3 family protein [Sphingomonas sp.]|nr:gluconate 2-dehydrogenase subunit 3 family protein [Sphingomonas sp.]